MTSRPVLLSRLGTSAGAAMMSGTMIVDGLSEATPRVGNVKIGPGMEFIHGVIIDITDRKRAEEDLEIMRQRLEVAVEGAELGIWTLDMRNGSWWFSDRARDLIGLAANHYPTQRGFRERVHPDDWGRLAALYETGFPEGSIGVEYRVIHPDGTVQIPSG